MTGRSAISVALALCMAASVDAAAAGRSSGDGGGPKYEIMETKDIRYSGVKGYWTSLPGVEQDVLKAFSQGYVKSFRKKPLDLTLDLYRPEGPAGRQPLILFMHGGAYYIGSKEEPAYVDFCRHFASLGYVTASINYRLGFHLSRNGVERAGDAALEDARTALDFLVGHADEYGIDPDRIFLAGSSAGAITALKLAFSKEGACSHRILAVANMWGAVDDLSMLEGGTAAIISFHGEEDTAVPYDEGYPLSPDGKGFSRLLSGKMYGSSRIDRKAAELGLRHRFYSFPGEGHALNTDKDRGKQPNANQTVIKDRMAEFFREVLLSE